MFQRKVFALVLLLVAVFSFGCGEKKPKDVVKDFYYSLCQGDVDSAINDLTLRSQQALESSLRLLGKKDGLRGYLEAYSKECEKFGGIKDIKVETQKVNDSQLEWTAVIKYGKGRTATDSGYLVKTDKGWKIDLKK